MLLPDRRLETLVEQALEAQLQDSRYHNGSTATVSLFSDYDAGPEQMPSRTSQVAHFLLLVFVVVYKSLRSLLTAWSVSLRISLRMRGHHRAESSHLRAESWHWEGCVYDNGSWVAAYMLITRFGAILIDHIRLRLAAQNLADEQATLIVCSTDVAVIPCQVCLPIMSAVSAHHGRWLPS